MFRQQIRQSSALKSCTKKNASDRVLLLQLPVPKRLRDMTTDESRKLLNDVVGRMINEVGVSVLSTHLRFFSVSHLSGVIVYVGIVSPIFV